MPSDIMLLCSNRMTLSCLLVYSSHILHCNDGIIVLCCSRPVYSRASQLVHTQAATQLMGVNARPYSTKIKRKQAMQYSICVYSAAGQSLELQIRALPRIHRVRQAAMTMHVVCSRSAAHATTARHLPFKASKMHSCTNTAHMTTERSAEEAVQIRIAHLPHNQLHGPHQTRCNMRTKQNNLTTLLSSLQWLVVLTVYYK